MGATRRRRQSRPHATVGLRLRALALAVPSVAENTPPGTLLSVILGATDGSVLSLPDDGGGRFALSGRALVAGNVALDREAAASYAITLRETLTGYANSPRDTALTVAVLNQFEAPDLGPLSLSRTEFVIGSSAAGALVGATAGSSISSAGLPAGLTVNGADRTWAWDGSGSVSDGSLSLVETHADASNSPRVSPVSWQIVTAPAAAISDEFPILKAAYESGGRALISMLGDSTTANLGGGSDVGGFRIGDAETTSTAACLRDFLIEAGLQAITGTFVAGDHGFNAYGVSPTDYGKFYSPDVTFDASFNFYGAPTPMGLNAAYSAAAGDKVRWTPGLTYDRVEGLHLTFGGAGSFDVRIAGATIQSVDGNASSAFVRRPVVNVAPTSSPIDQVVTSGFAWPGALRVWNSGAGAQIQVENLGISSAYTSTWADAAGFAPGAGVASLGAHLCIVNLGLNDHANGVSAATMKANLKTIVNLVKAAGADVLVCIPSPGLPGSNYDLGSSYRTAIGEACSETGIGVPVDLYGGIGFDTAVDLSDIVHPNAAGNRKIVYGVGGLGGIGARILGLA